MKLVEQAGAKRSPLYTSRAAGAAKREIIQAKGKDSDGAYRAYNRLDSKKAVA
jgi:hypothetical protein